MIPCPRGRGCSRDRAPIVEESLTAARPPFARPARRRAQLHREIAGGRLSCRSDRVASVFGRVRRAQPDRLEERRRRVAQPPALPPQRVTLLDWQLTVPLRDIDEIALPDAQVPATRCCNRFSSRHRHRRGAARVQVVDRAQVVAELGAPDGADDRAARRPAPCRPGTGTCRAASSASRDPRLCRCRCALLLAWRSSSLDR